jgi:molybdenum cofactor biosynthesis enzyme MoaA
MAPFAIDTTQRYIDRERLDTLIFFVTNICNLKCGFCCYADHLNKTPDVSFDNIKKMSRTIGKFRALLISGGEPFLRKDLDEILVLFASDNGVSNIYIPTNGYFLERTERICASYLERVQHVTLTLSFSIDAMEASHNAVRGGKNTFQKACETLGRMSERSREHPNLRLRVNSVVTPDNIRESQHVIDYFFQNYRVDEHNLEIVRGDSHDHQEFDRLQGIAPRYLELVQYAYDLYAKRAKENKPPLAFLPRPVGHAVAYSFSRVMAEVKTQRINGKHWSFPCTAGRNIVVVSGSGDLSACELRKPVVHLKDFDFDLRKAMDSLDMQMERQQLLKDRCHCTHGCFVGNSLQYSLSTIGLRMAPQMLKYALHSSGA